jgi:pyruvate dehydrogenase E1 component alpha subunit/2-oxoisovalerate dehydrogenase E1 component alpha subunit
MDHSVLDRPAAVAPAAGGDDLVRAYRWMLLARVLDDKMASLYRGGKIHGGVYLSRGQEALGAVLGVALRKGDIYAPLIRDLAGRLAFGESVLDGVRTCMGSALGPMRGRDGNIHRGRPKEGLLAMISHLGAMIPAVNGCLMAHRFQGITGTVGATSIGDGGTSTGAFHEGMNQAAVEKLPLVLIVANNQYAYSTPTNRQFACRSLVDRAIGYGVTGHEVDATSLSACSRVIGEAVKRARAGGGPQLVVAELLRLCGHGEHDDASYVDPRLKASPLGRDCLKVAEEELLARKAATAADFATWRAEIVQVVEDAVAQVQREPTPDPFKEDWCALSTRRLRDSWATE